MGIFRLTFDTERKSVTTMASGVTRGDIVSCITSALAGMYGRENLDDLDLLFIVYKIIDILDEKRKSPKCDNFKPRALDIEKYVQEIFKELKKGEEA